MREVGQRRQPLGIRLTLLEPIADLLDHLIKRVQSQMWYLLFAQFLAIDIPLDSVLNCLLKRAEPAGASAGESHAASGWLTRMGLSQKSTPPCRESADCGTIHLRTSCTTHHADLSCRIPGRKLDARCATRRCTHRRDPRRRLPPGNTEGRGGSQTAPRNARGRQTCARSAGRACPCTPSWVCEVLTRGELTRLQAATSTALATYNQTSLPFG